MFVQKSGKGVAKINSVVIAAIEGQDGAESERQASQEPAPLHIEWSQHANWRRESALSQIQSVPDCKGTCINVWCLCRMCGMLLGM